MTCTWLGFKSSLLIDLASFARIDRSSSRAGDVAMHMVTCDVCVCPVYLQYRPGQEWIANETVVPWNESPENCTYGLQNHVRARPPLLAPSADSLGPSYAGMPPINPRPPLHLATHPSSSSSLAPCTLSATLLHWLTANRASSFAISLAFLCYCKSKSTTA